MGSRKMGKQDGTDLIMRNASLVLAISVERTFPLVAFVFKVWQFVSNWSTYIPITPIVRAV